jgi:hypothetical protein
VGSSVWDTPAFKRWTACVLAASWVPQLSVSLPLRADAMSLLFELLISGVDTPVVV